MSLYLRLLHGVVQRGIVPPAWISHKFCPSRSLDDAIENGCDRNGTPGTFKTVSPSGDIPFAFAPAWQDPNTETLDSFECGSSDVVTLKDCFIASCTDQYGLFHYAVFDHSGKYLRLDGFLYWPDHGKTFHREAKHAAEVDHLVWPLRRWPRNHCHWMLEDLPSILLAMELGMTDNLVLPGNGHQTPFNQHCISELDLPSATSTDVVKTITRVKHLDLVRSGDYQPSALKRLRTVFADSGKAAERRVYICRDRAKYRRCANEDEVWGELEQRDFERVYMEDLSPMQQISTMAESKVVVGVHGAGMANAALAPQDAAIVEIADAQWESENKDIFLKLSSALSQRYIRLDGVAEDPTKPGGYRDLIVNIQELSSALDSVL